MQNKNDYITMLGTGNALATRCYNTCFTLHGEKGVLLVDAGGGNGILTQLEKAGIRREDISDLFVTHAHTDHLLGCVWIMRMALQFRYSLRVWSHKKVLDLLTDICRQILPQKEADGIGNLVTINCLEDGDKFLLASVREVHVLKSADQDGKYSYPDSGYSASHGLRVQEKVQEKGLEQLRAEHIPSFINLSKVAEFFRLHMNKDITGGPVYILYDSDSGSEPFLQTVESVPEFDFRIVREAGFLIDLD